LHAIRPGSEVLEFWDFIIMGVLNMVAFLSSLSYHRAFSLTNIMKEIFMQLKKIFILIFTTRKKWV